MKKYAAIACLLIGMAFLLSSDPTPIPGIVALIVGFVVGYLSAVG